MSRDRFDALDRFEPLFQVPEPSFERFVRRRDRKRRNQRIAAGAVGIGVFVATIWVITSGEVSDRGTRIGGSVPTTSPDVDGIGIVGLPPEDAMPSLPARGELVVGFHFGHTQGDPGRFSLHLYADGRVIWQRLTPGGGAWIEQHLTPEGIELVRSEVLSTGLFDPAHDRELVGSLGDLYGGWIEVRTDRLERVWWGGRDGSGFEDARSPIQTTVRPEDVVVIDRLDARLEDLRSWLPASAWEDQDPKPFVASRYNACLGTDQGDRLEVTLSTLPRPAAELLRGLTWTHDVIEQGPAGTIDYWCSFVTTDEARAVAKVIDDADAASSVRESVFGLAYDFDQRVTTTANVTLDFEPALPDAP